MTLLIFLLGGAAALMLVLMSLVWLVHLRLKNAGIVDVAWSFGLGLLALLYFAVTRWDELVSGQSFLIIGNRPEHGAVLAVMVLLWSTRLTLHLFQRNVLSGGPEDARYADLRVKWKDGLLFKFFLFFNAQGLMNVFLSLGFLIAMLAPKAPMSVFEWAGLSIWLIAIFGETISDQQLKKFKSDSANAGKVCDAGLWRYSRHPNYFFEWLVWVALFIFALGSPWGILGFGAPLLMLYLLLRVTGIPATEALSVQKKGEAYRTYQRTTSAFIPWFPKTGGG